MYIAERWQLPSENISHIYERFILFKATLNAISFKLCEKFLGDLKFTENKQKENSVRCRLKIIKSRSKKKFAQEPIKKYDTKFRNSVFVFMLILQAQADLTVHYITFYTHFSRSVRLFSNFLTNQTLPPRIVSSQPGHEIFHFGYTLGAVARAPTHKAI